MRPLGAPVPSERVVEMHNSTFAKATPQETNHISSGVEAARWTRSSRLWGARPAFHQRVHLCQGGHSLSESFASNRLD